MNVKVFKDFSTYFFTIFAIYRRGSKIGILFIFAFIPNSRIINIRNITGIVMNLKVAMSVSNCLCSPRGTEQSETVYMVLNLIRLVLSSYLEDSA